MIHKLFTQSLTKTLPLLLVVGGLIGLGASLILTLEKLALLQNPDHQLSCSLNPVMSCGSIIASEQASAFGFPNPIIGLIGFTVVVTVGMGLLAGAVYKKWFWRGLQIGTLFGVVFVHWLIYQSLYSINALCLYCMVVWAVTIPIFWYTLLFNLRTGNIKTPQKCRSSVAFANKHHGEILVLWYLVIIAAILERFWYYWSTLI